MKTMLGKIILIINFMVVIPVSAWSVMSGKINDLELFGAVPGFSTTQNVVTVQLDNDGQKIVRIIGDATNYKELCAVLISAQINQTPISIYYTWGVLQGNSQPVISLAYPGGIVIGQYTP